MRMLRLNYSMGVPRTKYAYEALSMDHFFLKGVEYLAIVSAQTKTNFAAMKLFETKKENELQQTKRGLG